MRDDLGEAILHELHRSRPGRMLLDDLKKRLPDFSAVSDDQWDDTLRNLSDDGLAECGRVSSGLQAKWGAVVNAGITPLGSEHIEEMNKLERYGDLLFEKWRFPLYADIDRAGADLREQFAHTGNLRSSSFYRAAGELIWERFEGLQQAFGDSYIRACQDRTADGVTERRERWLRRKLEAVWSKEFQRAIDHVSRLCQVAGCSPQDFSPQLRDFEIHARELKVRILNEIALAASERTLPVRTNKTVEPAISMPASRGRAPIVNPAEQGERGGIELLYSYSHKDEGLRDELGKHLSPLEREGLIRSWHDRNIGAGKELSTEIDAHLETADLFLLLVSPDFIASEYCYSREVKRAMERHDAGDARVIPVILRPVTWKRLPFGKLLALPTDGKAVTSWSNRDEAFLSVAEGVRTAVHELKQRNPKGTRSITLKIREARYTRDYNGVIVGAEISNLAERSDQVTDWSLRIPALNKALEGGPGDPKLIPAAPWLPATPFELPPKMTRGSVFFPGDPTWQRGIPQEALRATLVVHFFQSELIEQELDIYSIATVTSEQERGTEGQVSTPPPPSLPGSISDAAGPEVVIEYECDAKADRTSRSKPLTVRNLRGGTAYQVHIRNVSNGDLTAKFEPISHIPEGRSAPATAHVESPEGISPIFQDDFVRVLEAGYQDRGVNELFTPIVIPVILSYSDVNGKRYETECQIEFHHFHKTGKASFVRRAVVR